MKSPTHNGTKSFVILRASDKDARRTSTSTLRNKFNRTTLVASEFGLLFADTCYLSASYRLLFTDY